MGCGCAERMRNYVLPHTGYKATDLGDRIVWIGPDGDEIDDRDIDHHHTRLTAQIGRRLVRDFWAKLEGKDGSKEST